MNKIGFVVVVSLVCLTFSGCGEGIDPEIAALRQQFLVDSPLATERPVADVRKDLKSGSLKPDDDFVIRARINAGDFPPFAQGMAAFVVTDATGHDGDESHNPHECPFCKRDIKNVIARVEFTDNARKVIKIDANVLFDVKEFDLLLIQGTGRFDDDDTLIINAKKLFVKR